MSAHTAYLCTSCGHRFELAPEADHRCPKCLRASGIAPDRAAPGTSDSKASSGSRAMPIAAAVLLLAGGGVAAWYFTQGPAAPASAPAGASVNASTSSGTATAKGLSASEVPAPFSTRLDAAHAAVTTATAKLSDAAQVIGAVTKALTDGKIQRRTPEMDFEISAPSRAQDLAPALTGTPVAARAGSLELSSLAAAALADKGLTAEYGYVTAAHHAKTSILSRRFVVRVAGGKWTDLMSGEALEDGVTSLTPAQVLANTLALRAMIHVDHREGDEASRAIGFATKVSPADPAIRFASGEVQLFNELTDIGMSTLESVAKDHADAMTWQTLGRYAAENRQLFKAQQYYQKAAAADPKFAKPFVMMAQLTLQRLEVTPKKQHETLLGQIDAQIAKASAIDPKAQGIRTIQAQLAVARDKPEAAEGLMKEEVALHPSSRDAILSLAQYYIGQKKIEEALGVLRVAVAKGPVSYELHMVLGGLLAYSQETAEAFKHLNKALGMAPYDPRLRPQVARLHVMAGDNPKAHTLLVDQVAKFPEDDESRMLLVQLAMDGKRWDQAKTHLSKLASGTEPHPQVAVLRYLVAVLSGEAGAASHQAKAVAAVGKRSSLAQVLLEQGMLNEAEGLLREAMAKEPEDEQPPYMLVALLSAKGKAKEAQAVIDAQVAKTTKASPDQLDKVKAQFEMARTQGKKVFDAGMPAPPSGDAPTPPAAPKAPEAPKAPVKDGK